MALTDLQRAVCRLLAEERIRSGESYVAGGVALNELLDGARISRDIDLFHDTEEAVEASWDADRRQLDEAGYRVRVLRERPGFIEAEVGRDESPVLAGLSASASRLAVKGNLSGRAALPSPAGATCLSAAPARAGRSSRGSSSSSGRYRP